MFISFEGADGCGKSTQAGLLAAMLRARGLDVALTREPGGTPLGEKLRGLVLESGPDGPGDEAEMLIIAAARAQHVREVIEPALARGAVVISDRYIDSSIAYQGGGLGLPEDDVLRANLIATGGLWPDKTIWLHVEPRLGLERAGAANGGNGFERHGLDRIEGRGLQFQERVVRTYERLAAQDPQRWARIDVTGLSVDEVADKVARIVEPLLKEAGLTP